MKLKDRIKTYNFWVSLSSAVFLILKVLGNQFNFNVNENLFSDIVTSLCGILVILGIIVPPTNKTITQSKQSVLQEPTIEPVNNNSDGNLNADISNDVLNVTSNDIQIEECDLTLNDAICDVELNDIKEVGFYEKNIVDICANEVNEQNSITDITSISEIKTNNSSENELKQKVAEILAAQEKNFEGNYATYIELLQNQINLLQEK